MHPNPNRPWAVGDRGVSRGEPFRVSQVSPGGTLARVRGEYDRGGVVFLNATPGPTTRRIEEPTEHAASFNKEATAAAVINPGRGNSVRLTIWGRPFAMSTSEVPIMQAALGQALRDACGEPSGVADARLAERVVGKALALARAGRTDSTAFAHALSALLEAAETLEGHRS